MFRREEHKCKISYLFANSIFTIDLHFEGKNVTKYIIFSPKFIYLLCFTISINEVLKCWWEHFILYLWTGIEILSQLNAQMHTQSDYLLIEENPRIARALKHVIQTKFQFLKLKVM